MNSREIVRRTLDSDCPERVARSFEPSDFVWGHFEMPVPDGEWRKINEREWRRTDEWGSLWGRADETSGGQVLRGALEELGGVDTFPLPDFANRAYYAGTRERLVSEPNRSLG